MPTNVFSCISSAVASSFLLGGRNSCDKSYRFRLNTALSTIPDNFQGISHSVNLQYLNECSITGPLQRRKWKFLQTSMEHDVSSCCRDKIYESKWSSFLFLLLVIEVNLVCCFYLFGQTCNLIHKSSGDWNRTMFRTARVYILQSALPSNAEFRNPCLAELKCWRTSRARWSRETF